MLSNPLRICLVAMVFIPEILAHLLTHILPHLDMTHVRQHTTILPFFTQMTHSTSIQGFPGMQIIATKKILQKKLIILENSIQVGGWGWHRTDFPLISFLLLLKKNNISLKHLKTPKNHFKQSYFFPFFVEGSLHCQNCGQIVGFNFRALRKSSLATVR